MIIEETEHVEYAEARYIKYDGLKEPKLWIGFRNSDLEIVLKEVQQRNEFRRANPGIFQSPEKPFFVIKITTKTTVEQWKGDA